MHPNRLQCPHCSVTLRIRDRKHVGQQVDCPDCGQQILVLADGPRDLQFVKPAAAPPDSTEKRSSPAAVATKIPVAVGQSAVELSRVQQWAQSLTTATGVAWSVAAVAGVVGDGRAGGVGTGIGEGEGDTDGAMGRAVPDRTLGIEPHHRGAGSGHDLREA